jgi:hypothetical protein
LSCPENRYHFPDDAASLAGTRERAGRGVAEIHDRTRPPSMEIGFAPEMIAPGAGHAAYFILVACSVSSCLDLIQAMTCKL